MRCRKVIFADQSAGCIWKMAANKKAAILALYGADNMFMISSMVSNCNTENNILPIFF